MSSSDTPTVAVLGTGIMGAPMARNIAKNGFPTRVWNRTRAKAEPLAGAGASVHGTPAEAVKGARIVVTMLSDGDAVASVIGQAGDGLEDGAAWIQASTVGLEACAALAGFAAEHDLAYLDAPVLGTRAPAEQGQLVVLASGDESARELCAPVWGAIGSATKWLGDAGAGTRTKLVMNTWVVSLVEALGETLALARALGVPGETFLDGISGGALDAGYAQTKGRAMLAGDFTTSFPLAHALKDATLVLAAAEEHGLDLPLVRGIAEGFIRGVEAGHGADDMAATYAGLTGG
jgi:3-hydroxyisobutyrate dehydrogenase